MLLKGLGKLEGRKWQVNVMNLFWPYSWIKESWKSQSLPNRASWQEKLPYLRSLEKTLSMTRCDTKISLIASGKSFAARCHQSRDWNVSLQLICILRQGTITRTDYH